MAEAKRDGNFVPTIIGVSTADYSTPITVAVNPTTHELQTNASGGGGGTQYTDNQSVGTPTGTLILFRENGGTVNAPNTDPLDLHLLPVDTSNTSIAISGGNVTSTSGVADDNAFTYGSSGVTAAGYVVDEVAFAGSPGEGHVGAARMSSHREAYSVIRDAAGNERGANITTNNAVKVEVFNSSGTEINTFTDTQYSDGDPNTTIKGTAVVFRDLQNLGDIRSVDSDHPFPVTVTTSFGFEHTEDALSSNNDNGVFMLGVRNDNAATTLTSNNGDYSGVATNDKGALYVANSFALDATLTGGSQKAIARGGAKGSTTAADVTSTSIDANTQALDVSVKGTATVDTELPAAAALSDAIANPTTPIIGAATMLYDNSANWTRQRQVGHGLDISFGLAATGMCAEVDDTSTASVTENQFGPVRMSTRRALLVEGVASGTPMNININQVAGGAAINSGVTGALAVGGDTASASADAGNPVKVGGKFNNTFPTFSDGNRGDLQIDSRGNLRVALINHNANTAFTGRVDNADAVAVVSASQNLSVSSRNTVFNGSSWDRQYNNQDVTILASGARTTTQTSADQTNFQGISAVIVVVDVTSAGTGSITFSLDGKDSVSGKYYNILTGSAITTNSTNVYRIGPHIAAVANSIALDYLPRTFRIVITHNNANSITYSVGYSIVRQS